MFGLGATELIIILVIVIVLFGARRLPEIGAGVGKAIKNFRAGMSSDEIDITPGGGEARSDAKSDEIAEGRTADSPATERQKSES